MFQIDTAIINWTLALRHAEATNVFIFFTHLGDWQTVAGLSIIAVAILGLLRKKREIIFFLMALISGEISKELLKFLIHRPRPDTNFFLIFESGYSFPSGHAVMSIIFYGMVGYFVYKLCQRKWQKIILSAAIATLIFLIGLSRVYLGVHWASDVIAGWLLGFAILKIYTYE